MKKKILSTLLAVCLFVGVAIPAVFAAERSDAAGDAKKVTKITIEKDYYEIKQGESKDFADQIAVYENDTKLVLDHGHIQYSLLANTGDSSDFAITGSEVKALKVGATATLTIFDNYSEKARTTVKIKAIAPTADITRKIESFTFADSLVTVPVGNGMDEAVEFVVESHPKGTKFTSVTDAKKKTDDAVAAAFAKAGLTVAPGELKKDDENKITYKIPAIPDFSTILVDTKAAVKNQNYNLEATEKNYVNAKEFKSTVAVRYVDAIKASGIYIPQNLTVKVGEKVATPKVTYYPSNANFGKKVTWDVMPYINDGNAYQYAVLNADNDKVIGVNSNNPAKARLQAKLANVATTECIVEVKPATWAGKVTPFISKTSGEMKVGGVMALEVANLPQDVTVAWSFDSKTAGIIDFAPWKGNKTNVYAKKAGTVDVKATLSNGEVYKATITIKEADAVKPADPAKPGTSKPSTNPQTGDSLFANLF